MKKWKLTITTLILGTILYSPKVSAKNLANISDFRIKSALLAQSDPKEAIVYFHRGINRHTSGDTKGAIEEYNQALQLHPNFPEVYYKRGISRHKLGDLKGAILDYNKAISLNANYPGIYNHRGFTRHNLGDLKGAIADFNKALSLNPNFPEAYQNRGITRNALGDKQGAITDLTTAANLFKEQKRISNYQEVIDLIQKIKIPDFLKKSGI
ncbi:MAG: tetratricopeptide repeat protein [Dolichospermum sp. LBC05a]|jgi:tetratricopeptide (TPR) repeat protein|nr:tetratricopeptide repeat protein [Dolichospermum sp. OL01]MCO5799200.1 tetratricopeptide repeat protein [Dolichospermum sp. OL03]MCS6280323.1 tetratricopeptide repeat protein [Dolichospermum sp.]QSV60572.1 MAG: tetratricopeptide repeat protein [Dolichospermum sp. LBC05a]